LVVIGVMAVIAAGVIAAINPQQKLLAARDANSQNAVGQVASALQAFAAQSADGLYPAALAGLVPNELVALPALPTGAAYTYTGGGTTAVSVSVPMQATKNTALGVVWCWRSAAGNAVFAPACAP
jgi:hypothetical protein